MSTHSPQSNRSAQAGCQAYVAPQTLGGANYDALMDNDSTTCSPDSSRISKKELNDVLDERGIALNTTGQKLLDFVAGGEMVCEALCGAKGDPKGGPFLMIVKVSLPQKDKYGALLTELTGDNKLAELFDPTGLPGPAYVRILRCPPAFWKVLKQSCPKLLA